jgi:hypothetical protein
MELWKLIWIYNQWRGYAAMIHREASKVTTLDLYRFAVVGLMGIFYGFLIVLFFL